MNSGAPHPGPEQGRLQQLAAAFAHEPEMIQACLQGAEQEPCPAGARLILDAAQMALARHPTFADLHYHASRAAIAAGDLAAASNLLDHALRLNPEYRDALILAAHVALTRQQRGPARTLLQDAVSSGADFPDVHLLLGHLCREEGDWTQARVAYERALALNANFSAARTALSALPPIGTSGKRHELSA